MDTVLREEALTNLFSICSTPEHKYQKIIELGKNSPPLPPEEKIAANLVPGCQSLLYLHSTYIDSLIYWKADSDALISKGLASLLVFLYDALPAEAILKSPPIILTKLGLTSSLSPTRAQGLQSLYLKMKQRALSYYLL